MYHIHRFRFLQILIYITSSCTASKVKFFKEHDFKGDLYETSSSTDCQLLPENFRNLTGSVKSSGCITVFGNEICHEVVQDGYRIVREDASKLTGKGARCDDYGKCGPWFANSFRDCTANENRIESDIDSHFASGEYDGKYGPYVYFKSPGYDLSLRDICGCRKLDIQQVPLSIYEVIHKSHGNCFKFYVNNKCEGTPWNPPPTLIYYTPYLYYESFEPCHVPVRCRKMKFNIFNDEPMFDSKPLGSLKKAQIGVTQTFYNDGIGTMEDLYSVSEEITESFEFQLSSSFREMVGMSSNTVVSRENSSTISTSEDLNADANFEAKPPEELEKFPEGDKSNNETSQENNPNSNAKNSSLPKMPKLKATMSAMSSRKEVSTLQYRMASSYASGGEKENTSGTGKRNRIDTTTKFTAEKQIIVPKCTNVKVTSFIRKAENVELDYRIRFEITDETIGLRRLTSKEIREEYKGFVTFLVGHNRSNEFTAVAETKGKLKAKFGIESIVEASGDPLEDCLKRHVHSICENM